MTINDLWHEVEVDPAEAALDTAKRTARRALAPKVSFLMEASSRQSFEDRMALTDDEITRVVHEAAGEGAVYAIVRESVVADLNEMFDRGETHRRRSDAARRARERRVGSTHHAATQDEVNAWLAQQEPDFAQWAEPYAQRMVYGPTYNRSVATNLPSAAKAFREGGFGSPQFRYFSSMLDAAIGTEQGEQWYMDSARGEYTQRLDNTMGAKQASFSSTAPASFVADFEKADQALQAGGWVKRDANGFEYVDPNAPPQLVHLYQSLFQMGYANGYFSGFGTEAAKTAKFVVRQRGTMSGGSDSYDTREEAQSKADALNTEHGTNDYIVSEEGDDKESVKTAAGDLPWSSPPFKGHGFVGFGELCRLCQRNKDDVIHGVAGDSTTYYVRRDDEGAVLDFSARSALKRTAVGVHEFGSSGEAYDRVQWDDTIKGGDVLVIPSEKVVGFAFSAWPAAVTKARGHLHGLTNPTGPPVGESYDKPEEVAAWAAGWAKAREVAQEKGWPLATSGDDYGAEPPSDDESRYSAKQAVELFDKPSGGPRATVQWDLAVDNGFSKTWVTGANTMYEGRVSTTPEGAIAMYNGRHAGEFSNAGRAQRKVEELIAKDQAAKTSAKPMDFLWKRIDRTATTEVGHYALTAVDDRIGAVWAITSKDGEIEYATGKSRSIESAMQTMQRRADIFGKDPDVANQTNPPKKKVKPAKDPNDPNAHDDPDAEDEVEDEEDPDAIEDDAEDEFPLENGVEDQVETVDPMTLDVGDTLTVSYTMSTGETGEVEGVFVRLEDDIAFFSGPNGEFGVAQRDGQWIDSEGNQFTFSFGSPDLTGDTDPNMDQQPPGDNPATPAEDPPVADKEDEGDTEYAVDDDKDPKKKKKSQPPWLKGKSTLTVQPGGVYSTSPNTGSVTTASTVSLMIEPTAPIRSMAELVTAIGELAPHLQAEEIFELAKQSMAASRRNAGR